MIRYRPGFTPQADSTEQVPSVNPSTSAALAAAREKQILEYTRKKAATQANVMVAATQGTAGSTVNAKIEGSTLTQNIRTDGPTMEQWTTAGYKPENYPPPGYAAIDTPAYEAYKATHAGQTSTPPVPHAITPEKQS